MKRSTRYLISSAFALSTFGLGGAAHAGDTFSVTFENPGVKNSTATFASKGTETFDTQATGSNQSFSTDFGTGGTITGNYSGVDVLPADQFGGAEGTGNYGATFTSSSYSLDLSTTDPSGINYFGFWLSALDAGNDLTFSKGGTTVFTFTPAEVLALVGGNPAYFANPSGPFAGQDSAQPYVFLNFFDKSGTFDKVTFAEDPGTTGGYESDNHTVGFFTKESGTPVSAAPEPASWALMIMGFGLTGSTLRRRRGAKATLNLA